MAFGQNNHNTRTGGHPVQSALQIQIRNLAQKFSDVRNAPAASSLTGRGGEVASFDFDNDLKAGSAQLCVGWVINYDAYKGIYRVQLGGKTVEITCTDNAGRGLPFAPGRPGMYPANSRVIVYCPHWRKSRHLMPDAVHWVDKYLVPFKACGKARRRARKFTDPQAAWDAWKSASELLWCLPATIANKRKMIPCVCEIVELVLPVFEDKYPSDALPKNTLPRQAVEAARRYALDPILENRIVAYGFANLADWAANSVPLEPTWSAAARAAARAAANVVRQPIVAVTLAHEVYYSREDKGKTMADIVRKHFPIAPVPVAN